MRGLLVLGGLLLAAPALAYDAPPPHSFAKPTAGGKFVFVMLHPMDGPAGKKVKEKYARSGLYPADDPAKLAWTCDWRANWEHNVFVSNDGIFAVRVPDLDPGLRRWVLSYERNIPPKLAGWEDAPALVIYQNGKPFRTLALCTVFDGMHFTDRDCFMGPIINIDSFDDATGRVVISTEAGGQKRTATVGFRTGEVMERGRDEDSSRNFCGNSDDSATPTGRRWSRMILLGVLVVGTLTAAFVGVAVLLVRQEGKRKA